MALFIPSALVLGLIGGFGVLHALSPELYYQHVQEDQPLEWATFWGFIVAAAFFVRAAFVERRKRPAPWFFLGIAAFCVLVAMEEISWGQRLFGYSPPRYFLENNFQQELNLHNVMATSARKLLLVGILAGYGLLLPLLDRIPSTAKLLTKFGVTAPPAAFVPVFVTLVVLIATYPVRYTGEIVEASMALAFMFSAVAAAHDAAESTGRTDPWPALVGALSLVVLMGFGSALWSCGRLAAEPAVAKAATTEIRAVAHDLRRLAEDGKLACGKHERLNFIAKLSRSDVLATGRFNSLTRNGLPPERARFFIDPWATAYWVRTTCNAKRVKVFLYSFGPNRRRDSQRWKLQGDDIGLFFRVYKDKPAKNAVARSD